MTNHSAAIQRTKLLKYLKENGSATTIDIRHELDILAPAPRVYELRHDHNINIATTWDDAENPEGTIHKVARYILKSGKFMEEKE